MGLIVPLVWEWITIGSVTYFHYRNLTDIWFLITLLPDTHFSEVGLIVEPVSE